VDAHYHGDHVGALLELAKQFRIAHFYDHGKPHQNDRIVFVEAVDNSLKNGR
jgi:glyoxylase-like metal-dependent hydrolase (beta-lactamase superfamily II)